MEQELKQIFIFIFAVMLCSFIIYNSTDTSKYQITEYEIIEEPEDTIPIIDIFNPYAISEAGKEFIKRVENLSLISYWDATGYAIGYGHHGKDIYKDMIIDSIQADIYFNEDLLKIEKSVERLIKGLPYEYNFSQGFIDGLSSLVYNCGESGIKETDFYQRLRQCRVENGIMNEDDWNFAMSVIKETKISQEGHIKRRNEEFWMMLD